MGDVLIYGDTIRHPELRHEVPLTLGDPFLYAEHGDRRYITITDFEWPRLQEAGVEAELISPFKLGLDQLLDSGMKYWEMALELTLRAVNHIGITEAVVPHTFPLMLAEHLRANGIELTPERELFDRRRRVKNESELAGIRRAQRAAEAGMDAARDLFRRAQQSNGSLLVDGEPLTSERVKLAIQDAFAKNGCSAEEFIVSHGPQSAIGHDMGSGEIRAGRADRHRPLAEGRRDGLLRGHDAHLLHRRRARRAARIPPPGEGVARPLVSMPCAPARAGRTSTPSRASRSTARATRRSSTRSPAR